MNIILLDSAEITTDGRAVLTDRRSEHIIRVLRSKCGDALRIGIINGPIGESRILEMDGGSMPGRVVLAVSVDREPPPRADIDLILALPRPIMLKKILAQAASLGVARIFLINAGRVEKSFFAASILQDDGLRQYLLHGLEQAGDTMVPEVFIHKRFRPFVEDRLPAVAGKYLVRLVAHPDAASLATAMRAACPGRILLAVGPEGGWSDFEVNAFREQGFEAVSLGERILRMDTAVVALLSQLVLWRQLQVLSPNPVQDRRHQEVKFAQPQGIESAAIERGPGDNQKEHTG